MRGSAAKLQAELQEQLGAGCRVEVEPLPRSKTLTYTIRCLRDGPNSFFAFSTDELLYPVDRTRLPLVIAEWRKHVHARHGVPDGS